MKKFSGLIQIHFWIIFLCLAISAQEFKTVQNGIEYAEIEREVDKLPVKINLLRLDLTKARLDVVHAMDAAIGLETTSSMAARHGAIAAINAGFFRLDRSIFAGNPTGILMIDGMFLSDARSGRIALIINNKWNETEIFMSRLDVFQTISIGKRLFEVTGVNRQRGENDLIIYTPEFHLTTLTDNKGLEVVVKNNKIFSFTDQKASTRIPQYSFVISASGTFREQLLEVIQPKAVVTINRKFETFELNYISKIFRNFSRVDIVGGVPQLIKNGKIEITWEQEKAGKSFTEMRHPRTAVAKLKDGKFLMATVNGRSEKSVGMNLQELAEFLLSLGATDAMNLDGGGSTTMVLGGKVVNQPSDKEGERRVSDAILVFPRK